MQNTQKSETELNIIILKKYKLKYIVIINFLSDTIINCTNKFIVPLLTFHG